MQSKKSRAVFEDELMPDGARDSDDDRPRSKKGLGFDVRSNRVPRVYLLGDSLLSMDRSRVGILRLSI